MFQPYIKKLEKYVTKCDATIRIQAEFIEDLLKKQNNLECQVKIIKVQQHYLKKKTWWNCWGLGAHGPVYQGDWTTRNPEYRAGKSDSEISSEYSLIIVMA